jgi:type VI secretion system protein ImpJ
MSWYSKVVWAEGLFLRQHHLQQHDRYVEHLVDLRSRHVSPYPWGFSSLEIDRDLAQQNKFGLRRASGIFPDGTPFDLGDTSPVPNPVDVPEGSERKYVYLTLPGIGPNTREVDMSEGKSGSRYVRELERVRDSTAAMHLEEELEVAHLRAELTIAEVPKPGYNNLLISRIVEVRDKTIILDENIVPPVISCHAHAVPMGWLDRVIGWVETRLESLSRYATDPSSGGGLQAYDYFMLQMLNREINVLKHYRASRYTHPETLYVELLRLAGELSTFSGSRLVPSFPKYDQDNLRDVFDPLLNTIQKLLSLDCQRHRPQPVPQCALYRRSCGGHAADADTAAVPRTGESRPEHQNEGYRADTSARHPCHPHADTAAPDPGDHRTYLFPTGEEFATMAGIQCCQRLGHAFRRQLARSPAGALGDCG